MSGMKLELDSRKNVGDRVQKMSLTDGQIIEPNDFYTLGVNTYMYQGGDGYTIFQESQLEEL